MSRDVIALVTMMPDAPALLAGMAAAGEGLLVHTHAGGAVVRLTDDGGHPLLTIEAPVLVAVPGEVARLLDDKAAEQVPTPAWWIEARAAGTPPDAVDLAYRFADEVVRRLGGVVWPPNRDNGEVHRHAG
jgi:hypothetical protein